MHRRGRRARAPRRDRAAAARALTVSSDVPQSVGRVVERGARGRDRARARRRRDRPAAPRGALPGGREPGGRRAVRDHGPGRRRHGPPRRGASDPLPTRRRSTPSSTLPDGIEVVGVADRRRARRRAARPTAGRAPPRSWASGSSRTRCGRTWPWVSELPRDARRRAPRSARRRDVPRPLGRHRRRRHHRRSRRDVSGAAATRFGVEEHARTEARARRTSSGGDVDALGPLMAASHAGYDAMGLGHPAATADGRRGARADPASTAPVRAAADPAAPSSSCATAARSTTSTTLIR